MAKNRILISVVLAALLGYGFYSFALKPLHKEAADLQTQVASAQAEVDAARALIADGEAARKSFRGDYANVVRLGKAVPGDDDVRSLVVQLDESARRSGVSFESISVGSESAAAPAVAGAAATPLPPGATIGPAGFPIMPFSFEFKGPFFRLGAFFARLENYVSTANERVGVNGRLLTVDGLRMEPDASGFPNIRATVAATSYLVSPLEGATGGATPAGPATTPPGATAPDTTTTASTGAIR